MDDVAEVPTSDVALVGEEQVAAQRVQALALGQLPTGPTTSNAEDPVRGGWPGDQLDPGWLTSQIGNPSRPTVEPGFPAITEPPTYHSPFSRDYSVIRTAATKR